MNLATTTSEPIDQRHVIKIDEVLDTSFLMVFVFQARQHQPRLQVVEEPESHHAHPRQREHCHP